MGTLSGPFCSFLNSCAVSVLPWLSPIRTSWNFRLEKATPKLPLGQMETLNPSSEGYLLQAGSWVEDLRPLTKPRGEKGLAFTLISGGSVNSVLIKGDSIAFLFHRLWVAAWRFTQWLLATGLFIDHGISERMMRELGAEGRWF